MNFYTFKNVSSVAQIRHFKGWHCFFSQELSITTWPSRVQVQISLIHISLSSIIITTMASTIARILLGTKGASKHCLRHAIHCSVLQLIGYNAVYLCVSTECTAGVIIFLLPAFVGILCLGSTAHPALHLFAPHIPPSHLCLEQSHHVHHSHHAQQSHHAQLPTTLITLIICIKSTLLILSFLF